MSDFSNADKFVLSAAAGKVAGIAKDLELETQALRAIHESLGRQPNCATKSFAMQSLERTILAAEGLRANLNPLHRTLQEYQFGDKS